MSLQCLMVNPETAARMRTNPQCRPNLREQRLRVHLAPNLLCCFFCCIASELKQITH